MSHAMIGTKIYVNIALMRSIFNKCMHLIYSILHVYSRICYLMDVNYSCIENVSINRQYCIIVKAFRRYLKKYLQKKKKCWFFFHENCTILSCELPLHNNISYTNVYPYTCSVWYLFYIIMMISLLVYFFIRLLYYCFIIACSK